MIQKFRAHDQSHPRSAEIYAELKTLSEEIMALGHKYDASWITRSLGDHETVESVLCGHSEKLAIAWTFVADRTRKRIQVVKNLRICGDCRKSIQFSFATSSSLHSDAATKVIALSRRCEITVRDMNRIHLFTPDGRCSCADHF